MKKLMLLGGLRYQIPVIKAAHQLGCHVITCDYLPNNDAHRFSDKYVYANVVDKNAVLEAAQRLQIDGIISFACDPGVVTAAYVAEKMGLPFQCSYNAAQILQDKGLFRQYLADNGFNVPHAKRYTDSSTPFEDIDFFTWPVIVKPVDSAGSKGVTRVNSPDNLQQAITIAMRESCSGAYIIEDFLTFKGYHSSADPFTVDGEIKFITYSDQLFDPAADNPYTPSMIIWPTTMEQKHQDYLSGEIQRLVKLLDMKTGIYNIETCIGSDGTPYIMEVSPRGGGCKIAEIQELAYGVKFIENEVRKAINMPLTEIIQTECSGYWCEAVIHAGHGQSGIIKEITINPEIKEKYLKLIDLPVKEGDMVMPFSGANMSLGDIFLRFDSRRELNDVMSKNDEWLRIILKD